MKEMNESNSQLYVRYIGLSLKNKIRFVILVWLRVKMKNFYSITNDYHDHNI